jgi:hypothetical protein
VTSELTKTVADLTEALGLPATEASAVATWCGIGVAVHLDTWLPIWTDREMAELVTIWHETGPEASE